MKLNRFESLIAEFQSLPPVLVAGDIGIDKYTYGEVRRISPEAPVPVLEVTKEWLKLGLAANISHNLKTLGVGSLLCGVIGDDSRASVFESLLEESDLRIWGVIRDKTRPTIYKERVTTGTQQICRIDYESQTPLNLETETKLTKLLQDFAKDHGALILEDYAKGTLTKNLIQGLIQTFKAQGKIVCVDPGSSTPPHFYQGATLLKPNLKEARLMVQALGHSGDLPLAKLCEVLIKELSIEKLAITLGADGMAIVDTAKSAEHSGEMMIIPTVATEVYDVSGAGDTAISLLTSSLMSGATLAEAALIANCGSGVVVGKKGTATVDLTELKEFFLKCEKGLKKS